MSSSSIAEADRLWVVHIGNDNQIALRARDEGFVCIGWEQLGDLKRLGRREDFKAAMQERFPDASRSSISAMYGQVYRFVREMRQGDPIVFPVRPTREIAIGRITGEYEYVTDDRQLMEAKYPNLRRVEWLKIVEDRVFTARFVQLWQFLNCQ